MAKTRKTDLTSVGEMVTQLELFSIIVYMNAKRYGTWKNSQFLIKLNILLPYNPAIPLCIYLRDMKTLCPEKHLHLDVHSSFIYYSPKLEQAQISTIWRIKKLPYSNNGISLSTTEGKTSITCSDRNKSQKHPELKQPYPKGYIIHTFL